MQKKLISLGFTLVFFLTLTTFQACSFPGVYKINVQQGNIITPKMLATLKEGMTKKQVHFVLGKPVIKNVFNESLENYVYSYQKAGGVTQHQTIKIFYSNGSYQRYEGTLLEDNPAY